MQYKKNYLIFGVPLFVAICTISIFLAATGFGWTRCMKKKTSAYCERAHEGWINEPANTWSALGFVVVGLIIAGEMQWGSRRENSNVLTNSDFMIIFFSSLVVCLGPGSMVMHSSCTNLGGELDHLSMSFVCSFLFAYSIQRFFCLNLTHFLLIFLLILGISEISVQIPGEVPIFGTIGNLVFAIFIVLIIINEILIIFYQHSNIRKRWGIATLVAFSMSFLIWNFSKDNGLLCDPDSLIQGHAAWHLLDALALYFLFRYYVSENNSDHFHLLQETK
ncbi:unnamed protein product [Adineta ricciae]|uniref:Alkaline ceramidase n=1 Tax=Adineta ricciae TaxID=249248 RepID=A0A813SLY1_ADIRI|nr:unnamed protein product [Adineta ricciae]CAF1037911.1 unnamed protein product [Adineta ricciae]